MKIQYLHDVVIGKVSAAGRYLGELDTCPLGIGSPGAGVIIVTWAPVILWTWRWKLDYYSGVSQVMDVSNGIYLYHTTVLKHKKKPRY